MRKFLLFFACFLLAAVTAMAKPVLSFFNEMKTPALVRLFGDSTLIPHLQKLHAGIRMGMLDLTPERAAIIQSLNKAGIPVVAYLLLQEDQGYWLNSANGAEALERYREVRKWISDNQLVIKGIGLDFEFDLNDLKLIQANPRKMFRKVPGRMYDRAGLKKGREQYEKLISEVRSDGFAVETYYVPLLRDESTNNRTALQQVTRFMDIRTDHDIPLLYSSFFENSDGMIQVYGFDQQVKYMAVGSTGGGIDSNFSKLSYEELVRALDIAAKKAEELHIYSLEGCVQEGFLPRLVAHTYDSTLVISQQQVTDIKKFQRHMKSVSNILSYPTIIFLTTAILSGLLIWLLISIIRKIADLVS